MSWLDLLQDDSLSDSELLHQVIAIEQNCDFPDDGLSESQCVASAIAVEEVEELWGEMLNSQVLEEVLKIESSLELLLQPDAMQSACANLSKYQGPAVPIPTLWNDSVILLTTSPSPMDLPTFDLGFFNEECHEKAPVKPVWPVKTMPRQFKEPWSEEQMDSLGKKKFTNETYKKIHWVLHMYHTWHKQRNCRPDLPTVFTDFDNIHTLTKFAVCYGLSRLITEIRKVNGKEFPPKTLYEKVVCFQMHLESLELFWKLLDDMDRCFIMLKYTVDNVMKERASSGSVCITK